LRFLPEWHVECLAARLLSHLLRMLPGSMNPVDTNRLPDVAPPATQPSAEAPSTGRFAGKVALVTGAGDRGIGGAIAERLAREGAGLSVATIGDPQRLLKRLNRFDQGVVYTQADITVEDDVRRIIDDCMEEFGKIDILVNNAGIAVTSLLEKMSDADLARVLQVNLFGTIAMSRAVLPHLIQPGGVIVNIASALGLGGCPGFSVYSATKAGLMGFTQSLSWELAPRGIRVVGVAPALVHSPMAHQYGTKITPETWKQVEACHPLGIGMPHDVASAVAFLASDEARWITGVTLPLGWAPHFGLPTSFVTDGA